jgi:diguanylate cyclase (GGDEF)-like protein/PAS domain S-box-containing protein
MASRAWKVYLVAGLLLSVAYFFMPPGLGHHVVYDALGVSSVAAILIGLLRNQPRSRAPWLLFAAGQLMFVFGDSIRAVYESVIGVEAPFPSFADVAYIAAYPVLAVGLALLVRSRDPARNRANLIDALIVVTSAGVLSATYLIAPYIADDSVSRLEIGVSILYPLADLLLLAFAARLMVSPGVRSPAYYMLIVSLMALFTSDSFLIVGNLNGTYHTGSLVDAGFLASYVLWGVAALHPSMVRLSDPGGVEQLQVGGARVLLLAGASLLAPGVRIVEHIRGTDPPVFTTVLPTVLLFALVMVRMWGLVQNLSAALSGHEEAETRRRESEERFGSLVQHSSDLVTVADEKGTITYQSPSVQRVLGYGRQELIDRELYELVHPDDREAVRQMFREATHGNPDQPARLEYRWCHNDGGWRDVETTLTNLLDDPSVRGVVLNTRDVTDRTALQAQLTHQAFHDPLTDLANRALFRDRVEHALQRRGAPDEPVAVLFLDVDDFKTVNDSLGHSAGDQLLTELGGRIRGCLRNADTAARLGGDEFGILLEENKDAQVVATRIGKAVRRPFLVDDKEVFITVSIGISESALSLGGADELLRNADAAMYTAKGSGKARSVVFNQQMHLNAMRRLDLEGELRRASERDQFRLHYQPIVNVATGRVAGLEALVRWAHPERGLVGPVEFIPLAEETGLIRPIGRWVLQQATRQARQWHTRYPSQPQQTMSVNLSANQLSHPELIDEVSDALEKSGLAPEALVLEMTEHVIMHDTDRAIGKLEELKRLGVQLAVDDFGTGFSSLSYLRNFPIDILKIAKPFMDGIPQGEQETALVRGIIELGRNLELTVVAEGIERPEQLAALREMRCDLLQGYLVARPQGSERIERLLQTLASGVGLGLTVSPAVEEEVAHANGASRTSAPARA